MHAVKANELIKTIEKRGPFFVFDEIDQNAKARDYFFDLQKLDSNIAKRSVAFHNAENDGEKVLAWRLLLATFDEFRKTLYYLEFEVEDAAACELIKQLWGDCLALCIEAKKQKPNKTRCLALNNQSNLSWLLIRCCTKDVLTYYQGKLDKAWQDVLKDDE